MKERFAREVQAALDAGARQLQQLARSTMQTTFRSLLEDLAHRAEQAVDEALIRFRKTIDETTAQARRDFAAEADGRLHDFEDRLGKQGRQLTARAEQLQTETEQAFEEALDHALSHFQAASAEMLHALADSFAAHKPFRPHHKDAKPSKAGK